MLAVPNPNTPFPLAGIDTLCFLQPRLQHPQIEVGAYTYYADFQSVDRFVEQVRYLFDFTGDRLVLGKFGMIAAGVEFLMNGGNHLVDAISAYPFAIFGGAWAEAMAGKSYPHRGDTVVGHDVWLGYRAAVLPGVTIGSGAIIGAFSVVTKDVPPYAIVAGNPARVIRYRFEPAVIDRLLALAWWDWPIEKITAHVQLLTGNDPEALLAVG